MSDCAHYGVYKVRIPVREERRVCFLSGQTQLIKETVTSLYNLRTFTIARGVCLLLVFFPSYPLEEMHLH